MDFAAMHSRRCHGGEFLPSFKRSMAIVLGMVTAAILLQASRPNAFEPERLIIEPDVAFIRGVGGTHTLLFTAIDSEGSRRDVTRGVQVTVDVPDVVREISPGTFEARKFGFAKLRAVYQDLRAEAVNVIQGPPGCRPAPR